MSFSTLQAQCHAINDLLMSKNLFLRCTSLEKSFTTLSKKVPQNKNVAQRDLSTCVEECFKGFDIVRKLTENEVKELFKPTDIVYRPVLKLNQTINCYFSESMRNAFQAVSDLKK